MIMWRFISERFPLKFTIPITMILCFSSLSMYPYNTINSIIAFICVFLGMLIIRAVDDIFSIEVDKIKSPERGLPSGRINKRELMKHMQLLIALSFIINIGCLRTGNIINIFLLIAGLIVFYTIFYKNINKIPILIKPLFSNVIFGCIPFYISVLSANQLTRRGFLLGLFIYLSVIAHEYAHNAAEKDGDKRIITYTDYLGSRGTAILSLVCFITAFVVGIIFWFLSNKPDAFLLMLIVTMLQILVLELRLIKTPTLNISKSFYIYGFTFFLLPLLSLTADNLLRLCSDEITHKLWILILKILFLISPLIFAGISNMIFVKLRILKNLAIPIDGGKVLKDGERLFGSNKTWKGFIGMIAFTAFWFLIIGLITKSFTWAKEISLIKYSTYQTPFTELIYGAIWGFSYVLFELPNSYVKRRLQIPPGKNAKGLKGGIFTFIDQVDSVVGCMIFMLVFYSPGILEAVLFFIIGFSVHYLVNIFLFVVRLKAQAG